MNMTQYRDLIKAFYESHIQINTVTSGNQFNFNADSDIIYPIAHIEFINQNTNGTNKAYNFLVTIADIYDPKLDTSEEDIFSDSNLVADDTLDYFSNREDGYIINEQAVIQKFDNGHIDKLRGSVFTLTFNEWREANDCIIPINL